MKKKYSWDFILKLYIFILLYLLSHKNKVYRIFSIRYINIYYKKKRCNVFLNDIEIYIYAWHILMLYFSILRHFGLYNYIVYMYIKVIHFFLFYCIIYSIWYQYTARYHFYNAPYTIWKNKDILYKTIFLLHYHLN